MYLDWFNPTHSTETSSTNRSSKVLNWICHHRAKAISKLQIFSVLLRLQVKLFTDSLLFPLLLCLFSIFESLLAVCLAYIDAFLHHRYNNCYCWRWANKIKLLKCFVCASDDVDCQRWYEIRWPMKRFNSSNFVMVEETRDIRWVSLCVSLTMILCVVSIDFRLCTRS